MALVDNTTDAELITHSPREGGIPSSNRRVETKADHVRELEAGPPDVILSDYALPSFQGYNALAIAQKKCPEVPFIFVTGTLGKEVAIETLKHGATDMWLKPGFHAWCPQSSAPCGKPRRGPNGSEPKSGCAAFCAAG